MALPEHAEELLETLWIELVEQGREWCDAQVVRHDRAARDLHADGYVDIRGDRIRLTEAGHDEARNCIRRHRLAERLLTDVLRCGEQETEATSCSIEHVIRDGLEESICTLLGHPDTCPHGRGIPEGTCCREARSTAAAIVASVADLSRDAEAEVAFLRTTDRQALQKLIAMGVLPRTRLRLLQRFPAFVLEVGETQCAIDAELAALIMVRRLPAA